MYRGDTCVCLCGVWGVWGSGSYTYRRVVDFGKVSPLWDSLNALFNCEGRDNHKFSMRMENQCDNRML